MKHVSLHDSSNILGDMMSSWHQQENIDIYIHYMSDFSNAKKLRDICENFFVELEVIETSWISRLVLMLDELNNNAIEHGSLPGDENIFHLRIAKDSRGGVVLAIAVTDTGRANDHKSAAQMEDLRRQHVEKDFSKHTSIRGRGLFLIIAPLVDLLYFQDDPSGGLEVGFSKHLGRSQS